MMNNNCIILWTHTIEHIWDSLMVVSPKRKEPQNNIFNKKHKILLKFAGFLHFTKMVLSSIDTK